LVFGRALRVSCLDRSRAASIIPAQPVSQIIVNENPAFSWLSAGHFARAGTPTQGFGVHFQKRSGFMQVECFHLSGFWLLKFPGSENRQDARLLGRGFSLGFAQIWADPAETLPRLIPKPSASPLEKPETSVFVVALLKTRRRI
jgi:hypothetical protein